MEAKKGLGRSDQQHCSYYTNVCVQCDNKTGASEFDIFVGEQLARNLQVF